MCGPDLQPARPTTITATARGLRTSAGADDSVAAPATSLVTDLEGTARWKQEPERMAKAVGTHDLATDGFGRHSTVTDFARFLGLSTSVPRITAV